MPPTISEPQSLISCNPEFRRGRPTIVGTGTSVRTIVIDSQFGDSPEKIVRNRPHLSIEQVHAALNYYRTHKQEIDDDIEAENRAYDEACAAAERK